MSASYSEQLARVNNAITDRLQTCRRVVALANDRCAQEVLRELIEAIDDVRTLAKLLPLAAQEIREDIARKVRAGADFEARVEPPAHVVQKLEGQG